MGARGTRGHLAWCAVVVSFAGRTCWSTVFFHAFLSFLGGFWFCLVLYRFSWFLFLTKQKTQLCFTGKHSCATSRKVEKHGWVFRKVKSTGVLHGEAQLFFHVRHGCAPCETQLCFRVRDVHPNSEKHEMCYSCEAQLCFRVFLFPFFFFLLTIFCFLFIWFLVIFSFGFCKNKLVQIY